MRKLKTPVIFLLAITFVSLAASKGGRTLNYSDAAGGLIPQDSLKKWPVSFGFGRTATQKEIDRIDIDVRPDGQGLPPGSGTPEQGRAVYLAKCLACHGAPGITPTDAALAGPPLISDSLSRSRAKTIGNYWPYATTVFDYINRSMPYNAPGSLNAQEVYSVTAYLLYANKIIPADALINAQTLPAVSMPARDLFIPDDRAGGPEIK